MAEAWWRLPRRLRGLAIGGLVVLAGLGVVHRGNQSPWGPTRSVLVASADAHPGDPLTATRRAWPGHLVPDDALSSSPVDHVATTTVQEGQVLTRAHLADGLAGLLGPGEVALPFAQDLPELPPGATLTLLGTGLDGTGRRLGGGRLLARGPTWTWVAVDDRVAPAVAAALATGQVLVGLDRPP